MTEALFLEAVAKAQRARKVSKPLIIHTDRGRQYVSNDYINITADMQRSYLKKLTHGIMRV